MCKLRNCECIYTGWSKKNATLTINNFKKTRDSMKKLCALLRIDTKNANFDEGISGFLLIFLTAGNLIAIGGYKMPGVWGQRGPGAVPRRGPRGSAPSGVQGQRPWKLYYFHKVIR